MKLSLLIVGLGNPGKEYRRTRHNVGYQAIDVLSAEFCEGAWGDKQKFLSDVREGRIGVVPVLFAKPKTYMNLSGNAIRKMVDFYKLDPVSQVLVICDDIDIPLGKLRFRKSGGPGTHNGLKSVVETIGEGFPRLRIGIGPAPADQDLSNWVLSVLTEGESAALDAAFVEIPKMVREFVLGI